MTHLTKIIKNETSREYGIEMKIAQDFIRKLQDATGKEPLPQKFWEDSSSHVGMPTFQDVLNKYAEYCSTLTSLQKEEMDKIFWEQVKAVGGTPIIEDSLDLGRECEVYFLFPKKNLAESTEAPGTKKDLYLQGDFHGYGSTDGRQILSELPDTGIMCRKDRIPKESIVVYQYIQVEPSHRGKKPTPERSPFFENGEGFTPHSIHPDFPEIPQSGCRDEYSTHTSPYPGFDSSGRIFRVSADSEHAHMPGKRIDWPSLLSTETPSHPKHFVYHAALYSDKEGDLHRSAAPVTDQYHDDLYYSDQANSPYAHFTRAIQVFKPASGKIDNIIVVNDGIPSLITGSMDHFEKMVAEKKLSPNTAFVFINPLPGLKETLSLEAAEAFNKDPSKDLGGMGVRLIDYKHGIDQYTDFIANKLFPQLKNELSVPDDPSHRVMIGSSLSGTASVYIGSKRPDLFGAVIAQSPSPDNRAILSNIPREMLTGRNIHLSCGTFEHPNYAAANANIEYATELSRKLDIPLYTGLHGHEFIAWNEELEAALPALALQRIIAPVHTPAISYAYVEKRYDLGLMSESKRDPRKIYLENTTEGLQYEVIGLDGTFKKDTIPWDKLPSDFPKNPSDIIQSQVKFIPILLDYTSKAGHTQSTEQTIALGKKNAQSADPENAVDGNTRFPASSLSKIAFTYLVLQLVNDGKLDLDEPLHPILQYERFMVDGRYPEKAEQITARHVLSHTTGLPNFTGVSNASPTLLFNDKTKLGEGYSYSGEAFLYLQKVIETKTGKDLETLAQEYVFGPLGMEHSTFLPQREDDPNVVAVHTQLGTPVSIYESRPDLKYDLELMSSLSDLSQAEKDKIYLSENPREYYVKGMNGPASIPPEIDLTNLATKLNHPAFRSDILTMTATAGHTPHLNAAGSLLTTADDFSKFMAAWLENMDDPIVQQAFGSTNADATCGLGWHIYRYQDVETNEDKVIAYQFGENPNTRSFIAINVTDKKGAVFFTNSENGMSIATQILSSPDLAPIGNRQVGHRQAMSALFKNRMPDHTQSDEPGWKETLEGMIAEEHDKVEEARRCFEKAIELSPTDKSKQQRLDWFNKVHQSTPQAFTQPLETFVGKYTNRHNDEREIYIRAGSLMCRQSGHETKLVRISETEFIPEKDQSFKINFKGNQLSIPYIQGYEKSFSKQPSPESQSSVNQTKQFRDEVRELRYMNPTASSDAKKREKYNPTPLQITPKPPWRP